jgi:hypothetical protein
LFEVGKSGFGVYKYKLLRMEEQAKFGKLGILKKVGWILKIFHQ